MNERSVSQRQVLFDGKDIVVVVVASGRPDGVITFQSWNLTPLGDAPATRAIGFGEQALEKRGIDAFHVIPRRNHWYQTAEMAAAIDLAREFAADHRAMTYGSSMGGYGAIAFGGQLCLPSLALVPQFSLDPAVAPFERRWRTEWSEFGRFDHGLISGPRERYRGFMFYDPFVPGDAAQMALLTQSVSLRPIATPFSGHSAAGFVQRTYGLASLVTDVLTGTFDPSHFAAARRQGRLSDDVYRSQLAIQMRRTGRSRCADKLDATVLDDERPQSLKPLSHQFSEAMRNCDRERAAVWLAKAERFPLKKPSDYLQFGNMLLRFGRRAEAIGIYEKGLVMAPGNAALQTQAEKARVGS